MTQYRSPMASETLDAAIDDYLAGRLSAEDRSRLEALIEENPEVRHRVETLQSQEEALRHLGEEILDEPLPDRLLEALGLDLEDEAGGGR
ncbi:anti-sigma factor family protein [Caenispirillum salinarum]|uniref:anti-sigma factor family protein n=1 Tax=Caenispirillum salinarum TaxID=859058 RepID=UPI00384B6A62